MEARNRMADVVKLRCNILQDYMKMILPKDWRDKLYRKAEKYVENKTDLRLKYLAVYDRMREIGIEKYRVEDMDVTLMSMIALYCPDIVKVEKPVQDAVRRLTDERNDKDHSGENEEEEELYLLGLLWLYDLRFFVRTVDKYDMSISSGDRLAFKQKRLAKIDELKEIMDDERIELVRKNKQMDKDIEAILGSEDHVGKWIELIKYYHEQARIYKDYDIEKRFTIKASDAGVKEAHLLAATLFYSNDIAEYENRLYLAYCSLEGENDHHAPELVSDINRYLSERYERVLTERMKEIVDGMIEKGYPVSISDDSYVLFDGRFRCSPAPINVKKYMYFINEMVIKKGHKLSDNYMKEIEKYTKNGFPITRGDDGLYLWNGEAIQETLTKIDINGQIGYSFD